MEENSEMKKLLREKKAHRYILLLPPLVLAQIAFGSICLYRGNIILGTGLYTEQNMFCARTTAIQKEKKGVLSVWQKLSR